MADRLANDSADQALLEALSSSDETDRPFRELFRRYRKRLLAFFASRGFDRETGRDLSQEALIRVYRNRKSFRAEVPLSSWIFRIADNLAKNEIRRRKTGKRSGLETSMDDVEQSQPIELHTGGDAISAAPQPLKTLLAQEKMDALRQAVEQLPPRMRQTMRLWVEQKYSIAEISVILKVAESTVKVQLHQARKRLRKVLTEHFDEPLF